MQQCYDVPQVELLWKGTSAITSTKTSFFLEKENKKSPHYFLSAFKWSLCLAKHVENKLCGSMRTDWMEKLNSLVDLTC